jgi:hypothetical protein
VVIHLVEQGETPGQMRDGREAAGSFSTALYLPYNLGLLYRSLFGGLFQT